MKNRLFNTALDASGATDIDHLFTDTNTKFDDEVTLDFHPNYGSTPRLYIA